MQKAQVENLDLDYKNLDETTLLSALAQDYSNKKIQQQRMLHHVQLHQHQNLLIV